MASYTATHKWVVRHWPKTGKCEECGAEGKTDWANLDHSYQRIREHWRELCRRCHIAWDVLHNGLITQAERGARGNAARRDRTHCRNGHDLTGARRDKRNGGRICNACRRDYKRARRAAGLVA